MLNISRIGLAALAVLFTAQACFAHAVGERIECSPLGLPNSYFPGTIIEDNGGGAYTVKPVKLITAMLGQRLALVTTVLLALPMPWLQPVMHQ